MTASILCPGPSLKDYKPSGDLKLAVNRAAIAFGCDIWCAIDLPVFLVYSNQVIGTPNLLTTKNTRASLVRRGLAEPKYIVEDLFDYCPHSMRYCAFSATSAVILAAKLGATQINVYGADWTNEPDWDGVSIAGNNRKAKRWEDERKIWGDVSQWLSGRGVEVRRIIHGTT